MSKNRAPKSQARTTARARSADPAQRSAAQGRRVVSGQHADVLALQASAGNQAVSELLESPSGQPLDPETRAQMEARFQHPFSGVRVHAGRDGASRAQSERAKAYTSGQDIFFGAGRFSPETGDGQRLLAHELAHVIQQSRGRRASASSPLAEADADAAAEEVVRGESAQVSEYAPLGIQREGEDDKKKAAAPPPAPAKKIETRSTTDPAKAETRAQAYADRFGGRLKMNSGLTEIFNRSAHLSTGQLSRPAAGELGDIDRLLKNGIDGFTVTSLEVVPSKKGGRTPDFVVKLSNGETRRIEATTVTSAPAGRVTQKPTVFPGGKESKGGRTAETQARKASISDIKLAIRQKAIGDKLQLSSDLPGIPEGGTVTITVPFGATPKMIDDAVKDLESKIHADVKGIQISFTERAPSADGKDFHAVRSRVYYERQGSAFKLKTSETVETKGPASGAAAAAAPTVAPSAPPPSQAAEPEPPAGKVRIANPKLRIAQPKLRIGTPKARIDISGAGAAGAEDLEGEHPPPTPKRFLPPVGAPEPPQSKAPGKAPNIFEPPPQTKVPARPPAAAPAPEPPQTKVPGKVPNIFEPPPQTKVPARPPAATPAPEPPQTKVPRKVPSIFEPPPQTKVPARPPAAAVAPEPPQTKVPSKVPSIFEPPPQTKVPKSQTKTVPFRVPANSRPIDMPESPREAIGGGAILALETLKAILNYFGEKKQKEAVQAAWEAEWPAMQKSMTETGGGVIVYVTYTKGDNDDVLIFRGLNWSPGARHEEKRPDVVTAGGETPVMFKTYVPPSADQAAKTDKTALEFRLDELFEKEKTFQRVAERMKGEWAIGRWLRSRAQSSLDAGPVYDARANLFSARDAIKQGRYEDAKASLDTAETELNQMWKNFIAYRGSDKFD